MSFIKGWLLKFLLSICIFLIVSVHASVLDTGIVGMSNTNLTISSSADLYDYIKKLADENLTESYKEVAKPIDRLTNPYVSMANVKTYEEAFANLRYFYSMLYDANSTSEFDNDIKKIEVQKSQILSSLIKSKRKQFSDETVMLLLIKYLSYQKQIDYTLFLKSKMFETGVIIIKRVYKNEYVFAQNKQELEAQREKLLNKLQVESGEQKVITQNEMIVIDNKINFTKVILDLQQVKTHSQFNSYNKVPFAVRSSPFEFIPVDKNTASEEYQQSFNDALLSIKNTIIDERIAEIVFEHHAAYIPLKTLLDILENIKEVWHGIQDYTLFVFNNNGVQILDLVGFIYDLIIILCVQFIIIYILKKRISNGVGHLLIFLTKFFVTIYLAYDFTTNVLNFNASNLAMFASAFSIAIGFGMQSIIQNFVAGIILLGDKTIKVGDKIILGGNLIGTVESITYRTTTVKTSDDTIIVVPNSKVFLDSIENLTKNGQKIRLKAKLLVPHGSNIQEIETIIVNAYCQIPGFIDGLKPNVVIKNMIEDGILLEIRLFIADMNLCDSEMASRILYDELYIAKNKN